MSNPNDPTGSYIPAKRLRELLEQLPERVTVLLDEALIDFVDAEPPGAAIDLLDDFPRLLVFRTFSKAYGLAAMRCGYALGGPGSEQLIERIAPPLGVSGLAQAGALEALTTCGGLVAARRDAVIAQRRRVADALATMPIQAQPTQANFVWLAASGLSAAELSARLHRSRVIVAPGTAVGDSDHIRATIQSPPATDRLLEGLRQAVGT